MRVLLVALFAFVCVASATDCTGGRTYKVTFTPRLSFFFQYQWPTTIHWSPPVVASHSSGYTMFSSGSMASAGMELLAETGDTTTLMSELSSHYDVHDTLQMSMGPLDADESAMGYIDVMGSKSLASFASMIAPSPDWFGGYANAQLCDTNAGQWETSKTFNVVAYDAGTEDDTILFSIENTATSPQEDISRLLCMNDALCPGNDMVPYVGMITYELEPLTCRAVAGSTATDGWCTDNCNHNTPYCPATDCECANGALPSPSPAAEAMYCVGIVDFATNDWCTAACNHVPPVCPDDMCDCSGEPRPSPSPGTVENCIAVQAPATNQWCNNNCPDYCPTEFCNCDGTAATAASATTYYAVCATATNDWCQSLCTQNDQDASCVECCSTTAPVSPSPGASAESDATYYSLCVTHTDEFCTAVCNHSPASCDSCCSETAPASPGPEAADTPYYALCVTTTDEHCTAVCNHSPASCDSCCSDTAPAASASPGPEAADTPYYATCDTTTDDHCTAVCNHNPSDCGSCCSTMAPAASASPGPDAADTPYYATCITTSDDHCTAVCNHNPSDCGNCCSTTAPAPSASPVPVPVTTWTAVDSTVCQVYTDVWCQGLCTQNPDDSACGVCCMADN